MDKFTTYVTLVFIVKIIFVILAVTIIYVKHKKSNDKKLIQSLEYWKDRFEFIFKAMMSVMLIYLFNPRADNLRLLNYECKLLLYLFGFILIITANWKIFFKESILFKDIDYSIE
jgi:hypothetical protein